MEASERSDGHTAVEFGARADGLVVSGFRADLQGIRAIAVVLVVAFHADLPGFSGGFIGVDVFFVLSGYVITRMLVKELEAVGRIDFRRFYLRRIRRLLPALALLLAATMLIGTLLVPVGAQPVTARTGAAAAALNANTYLIRFGGGGGYFGLDASSNPLTHTWSLSVEEQFYLFFPALLAVVFAVANRRRVKPTHVLAAVLSVVLVASFWLSWLLTSGRFDPSGFGPQIAFYSAPTRAWEFAAGGLVSAVGVRAILRDARWAGALGTVGLALVVAASMRFDERTQFPGTAALVPVLGTVLLVASGESSATNFVSRSLGRRPLRFLGDLSYSWYLWHWPLIVFAAGLWQMAPGMKVVAAAISLLPAWLSYRLVESPIRFRVAPRPRRTVALGGLCLLAPLVAAGILHAGYRQLASTDTWGNLANHADLTHGCDNATPVNDRENTNCLWAVSGSKGLAVLVGDSNAGHFTEGFVVAANSIGLDALVATKSACPFVDLRELQDGAERATCTDFVAKSVAALVEKPPRLVVIASASDTYIETPSVELTSPDGAFAYRTSAEKARGWGEGLGRIVDRLHSAGIEVVIIHPVPRLPLAWGPLRASPLRLFFSPSSVDVPVDRSQALRYRARAFAAEEIAAGSSARTIDTFPELCPGERCYGYDGVRWLFLDGRHISVAASEMLAATFRNVFAAGSTVESK